MNIIFESYGGIGKIIMSTVIVKKLKQKFPESKHYGSYKLNHQYGRIIQM